MDSKVLAKNSMVENLGYCPILIIASSMDKGGMERQLALLLNELGKSYPVSLALFQKKIEYPLPKQVQIIDLKKTHKLDIFFLYRLFLLFFKNRNSIIHARGDGANYYTLLFAVLAGVERVIVEFRNSGEKYFSQYRHTGFIFKWFAKKNWTVIANSKTAADELQQVSGIKARYIPNGIDTQQFRKKITSKSKKNNQLTIGFTGRIVPQKNILLLAEAVHLLLLEIDKLNPRVIILGGQVDKNYFAEIKERIKSLKIEGVFSFIGPVPDPENYYSLFDIFVLPSHHEGTPNVLLEAMACEVYCLTSDKANCENVIPEEFVFSDTDAKGLSNKIKKYLTLSEKEKKIMCSDHRKIITKNYSTENMTKSYQAVYEHLRLA